MTRRLLARWRARRARCPAWLECAIRQALRDDLASIERSTGSWG